MYVCQLCNHFASLSYDSVLRHIGAVHSHQSGFRVQCGFDSCPRILTNYHAFRRHLRKKHSYCLKASNPTFNEEQLGEITTLSIVNILVQFTVSSCLFVEDRSKRCATWAYASTNNYYLLQSPPPSRLGSA